MANIFQSQRPRQIISIQKPYQDQAILVRLSEESELLDYPLEDIEKRKNNTTRNARAISNNNNLRYQKQKLILQQQPSISGSSSSIRHKYSLHLSPTNSSNNRQMQFPPFGSLETPSISNNTTTTATAGQSQMSSPLQYPNLQSQYLSTPQSPSNHTNPQTGHFVFQKQKKNLHYAFNNSSNCNNKLKSMLTNSSTATEQPEKSLTDFLHRTDRHLNIAATIDRINLLTKQQQTQSQQQQSPKQEFSQELLVQNPPFSGCKPTTNQNNFRNHSNSNSRRSPLTSFYQSGQDFKTECSDAVISYDEPTSKQKNLPYLEGLNYPSRNHNNNNSKNPKDSVEIPDGNLSGDNNSKQPFKVFSLTSTQFQLPQYNILQFCNSRYLDSIKQNKKQQLESNPNQASKNLSSTPSQPFLDLNIPGMAVTNGQRANSNTPTHSLTQKSGFKSKENPFSKTFNKDSKHPTTAIFEKNPPDNNAHNHRQAKQILGQPSSSQSHSDQLRSTFLGHKKKQKLSGFWKGTAHFKLTQATRDFTLNQIKNGLQKGGKIKPDGTSEGWRYGLQNSTKTDGLHFAELSQPKQINENSYINHHNSPKNSPNLENREFYKTISKEIPTDEDEEQERCHIEYVEKEFQKIFNSRFHKTEPIRKEDMVYNIKHLAILKYQREKKILEGSTNITDLLDYIEKKNEIQILIAQAKKIKTLEEVASVIENEIALQNNHITKIVSELLVKFDINLEETEEETKKS